MIKQTIGRFNNTTLIILCATGLAMVNPELAPPVTVALFALAGVNTNNKGDK